MEEHLKRYYELFKDLPQISPNQVNNHLTEVTSSIKIDKIAVSDRVIIAQYALKFLTRKQRMQLAKLLIEEQVVKQRNLLSHWSIITAQSSMIDTGYIAQHLVSLQTQIAGQGMRGKGDDLYDGSEVKSANFLDSLDKNGATAPRWNFTAITKDIMERFLTYKSIYLVSIDLNPQSNIRIRIWKVDISKHEILRNRYIEWMKKLGYPKFANTNKKPSVNFQLFPPNSGTDENYARHGNGRSNGFEKIKILLEDDKMGAELIFRADVINEEVVISTF